MLLESRMTHFKVQPYVFLLIIAWVRVSWVELGNYRFHGLGLFVIGWLGLVLVIPSSDGMVWVVAY